jgi:phosphomannomutase
MNNIRTIIFDLDGTLCKSTKVIETDMRDMLVSLIPDYSIWITTGASYASVQQQVPKELLNSLSGVYCCLGTEYYNSRGIKEYGHTVEFPKGIFDALRVVYNECKFDFKVEPTIIRYAAMLNFSVLQKHAPDELRKQFRQWDIHHGFREHAIGVLTERFPSFNFAAGGMVSIDITAKGFDKSLILASPDLKPNVVFFGDRCDKFGNDHSLVLAIDRLGIGTHHHVRGPEHTLSLLKKIRA